MKVPWGNGYFVAGVWMFNYTCFLAGAFGLALSFLPEHILFMLSGGSLFTSAWAASEQMNSDIKRAEAFKETQASLYGEVSR